MNELRPNKIGVIILLVLASALIVGANMWKTSLRVRKVEVCGNRLVEANEVIQLVQVRLGELLSAADLTEIQHNVLSHYYVKDALVERDLPGTLRVTVTERSPIAIVTRTETVYLDEDGVVLPRTVSRNLYDLPVISGIPGSVPMRLGSHLGLDDVTEALGILTALKFMSPELYHTISEIQLRNGGDIVLYSADGGVPIIFGRGGIASKLVRLETFWNTVVHDRGSQALQYVDLRYEDQVVARWSDAKSGVNQL